jgi:hypothetical protein
MSFRPLNFCFVILNVVTYGALTQWREASGQLSQGICLIRQYEWWSYFMVVFLHSAVIRCNNIEEPVLKEPAERCTNHL